MMRLCGKGHTVCVYDDWDPLERENRPCPACEKDKRIEDLQDEMTRILDQMAFDKAELEKLHADSEIP